MTRTADTPHVVERERKKRELSQEQMAEKLNITRQYYNQLVNYNRVPSVKLAKEIASELGLDWTIFFVDKVNTEATFEGEQS
ncbi:Helix-turn-helix [Paenibacillus algorifonticola]|uniref:Helix-turn-helix n=1 Tax=Paenibacillus algorifonticola TaxID=684063 RepID=A0A1I2GYE6_9BACL|nr:helix-turn-helix transcriptional regulator [Paenibacillus algorifonticola]SFF22442.1 Helix-turn-helix [Paenibacillus algorifonticola]